MNLTLEEQELIFDYYGVDLYEVISSPLPFRDDVKPSFSTKIYNDKIKWSDFGAGLLGMSTLDFIMKMESVDFREAKAKAKLILNGVEKVANSADTIVRKRTEHVLSVLHSKNWSDFEVDYWNHRGISIPQLEGSFTFPLRILKVDGKFTATSTPNNPKFIYYLGGKIDSSFKVYSPYDSNFKWLSNSLDLVDYETPVQNKFDNLIILSGRKDNLVFNNYNLCFDTTSSLSESNFAGIIRQLDKDFKKYNNVYSLFDFDDKGVEFSTKLYHDSNYRIKPIILGDIRNYLFMIGVKDIDELRIHNDLKLEKLIIDEICSKAR